MSTTYITGKGPSRGEAQGDLTQVTLTGYNDQTLNTFLLCAVTRTQSAGTHVVTALDATTVEEDSAVVSFLAGYLDYNHGVAVTAVGTRAQYLLEAFQAAGGDFPFDVALTIISEGTKATWSGSVLKSLNLQYLPFSTAESVTLALTKTQIVGG